MASRLGKIVGGVAGAALVLGGIAYAVVWNVPSVQNKLMSRVIASRMAGSDTQKLLDDGALHIYLCGTGSPMPDPSRANACTAVIAGGHIVIQFI